MEIRRGMILDIDFDPTRGSETGKIRPAVVVTNDILNQRVPVVQVVPLTSWTEQKGKIRTNIVIEPSLSNGLAKKSVADCLQTRPVDQRHRVRGIRGSIDLVTLTEIESALRVVFSL